jgi:hypothetical protein
MARAHRDGKRGFRVTVAGGTSILPVTGYVLYDFMPVEEMFNVAEAVVRVFHRFGDYEHKSRNRLKFTIRALTWDGFRQRYEEALAEFKQSGGASLPFDPQSPPASEQAPDWVPALPPTLQAVAAAASTPVHGPGIMPGTGPTRGAARQLPALDAQQRQQAAAGRLLPRDRSLAARRLHVGSDARARGSRRGVW